MEGDNPYLQGNERLFRELFAAGTNDSIIGCDAATYEMLRDFCHLQGDTRLSYTLVFQVDEFWSRSDSILVDVTSYITAPVGRSSFRRQFEDPFRLYVPLENTEGVARTDLYAFDGYKKVKVDDDSRPANERVDRVPFSWDFGFMLARQDLWQQAINRNTVYRVGDAEYPLDWIWSTLVFGPSRLEPTKMSSEKVGRVVSWRHSWCLLGHRWFNGQYQPQQCTCFRY